MPDHAVFDDFYLGTRARTLRQLTAMTADRELAADVVQEAYGRAWQRWHTVGSLERPQAWVRTVAWRLALNHYRRSAVASRVQSVLGLRGIDLGGSPDERLDVEEALRRLDPERRRALVLHDLCGLTVAEIADETGVAVGTVKSRLSRARADLAGLLGAGYPTGAPGEEALS